VVDTHIKSSFGDDLDFSTYFFSHGNFLRTKQALYSTNLSVHLKSQTSKK
jgi:hypothetical protein